MSDGPYVDYAVPFDDDGDPCGPEGWYIAIDADERYLLTRIDRQLRFQSRVDCERALASLKKAGLTSVAAMREAGIEKCARVMCEALAW